MILDDSVARWNGGIDFARGTAADLAHGLAALCDRIANALARERLLVAETINVRSSNSPRAEWSETLQLDGSSISSTVRDLLVRDVDRSAPKWISVHGHGSVFEPDGTQIAIRDLVWFSVSIISAEYSVWIETPSDAWLPLTLRDEDQTRRYELNAPRLERALTEIDESLGLQLLAEPSKYAEVVGFKLTNLSYGTIKELIDPE